MAAEKSVPPQIFAAIAAVMGEVGAVGKTRENVQQKYKFRGIDEVLQAVQLVCAKHGVVVAQRILGPLRCEERKTQSGGVLMYVQGEFETTFFAADGSSVSTVQCGMAMDSGDKAANKAMSVALKYALVNTFLIPVYEPRDPEEDSPEPTAKDEQPVDKFPIMPASGERWDGVWKKLKVAMADAIDSGETDRLQGKEWKAVVFKARPLGWNEDSMVAVMAEKLGVPDVPAVLAERLTWAFTHHKPEVSK